MVDFAMKWELRILAGFFALLALVLIAMTLFDLAIEDIQVALPAWAIVCILLAMGLWHCSGTAGRIGDKDASAGRRIPGTRQQPRIHQHLGT